MTGFYEADLTETKSIGCLIALQGIDVHNTWTNLNGNCSA